MHFSSRALEELSAYTDEVSVYREFSGGGWEFSPEYFETGC